MVWTLTQHIMVLRCDCDISKELRRVEIFMWHRHQLRKLTLTWLTGAWQASPNPVTVLNPKTHTPLTPLENCSYHLPSIALHNATQKPQLSVNGRTYKLFSFVWLQRIPHLERREWKVSCVKFVSIQHKFLHPFVGELKLFSHFSLLCCTSSKKWILLQEI